MTEVSQCKLASKLLNRFGIGMIRDGAWCPGGLSIASRTRNEFAVNPLYAKTATGYVQLLLHRTSNLSNLSRSEVYLFRHVHVQHLAIAWTKLDYLQSLLKELTSILLDIHSQPQSKKNLGCTSFNVYACGRSVPFNSALSSIFLLYA